jgi:ABC-type bacteriocin/lantibiotic exporter with double-glycine peptidase domain
MEAARAAGIHDDIMAMPMQYETLLREDGAALSGGQRQRIALARALVHKPAILLLDEATSALDVVTEARVQANLEELRSTRIVVAHRLSTVARADRIIVLADGKIAEQGTHAELLERGGAYEQLLAAQLRA